MRSVRNHGFLLEATGWSLSPAYDINPVPFGDGLTLNISEAENAQDLNLARDVAGYFRVKRPRAEEIIERVVGSVQLWRRHAVNLGIGRDDQDRMSRAFRLTEAQL